MEMTTTHEKTLPASRPAFLTLEYPAAWRRPRNPMAPSAAHWTRAFLLEAGLLKDESTKANLAKMDVAGYGGWPFGVADLPTLQTATAFLTLWILHDDLLEGVGEPEPETMVRAVRGEGPRPAQPFYGAWWDLGRRCRERLGRVAMERHGERFRAWLASLEVEAELVRRQRRGEPCSLAEYMEWRRINVGVLPTLDFLEMDLGQELPAQAWHDPRLPAVERMAAEIVALQNDLYGYAKDRRDGWPNAVCQLEAEAGIASAEAMARLVRRHNRRVAELERQGRELARGSALLNAWWQRLAAMVAGFAAWHAEAARYADSVAGAERLAIGDRKAGRRLARVLRRVSGPLEHRVLKSGGVAGGTVLSSSS
jgi:hypothetical protein